MELILALILFVGMVVCWLALPGSVFASAEAPASAETMLDHPGLQQAT